MNKWRFVSNQNSNFNGINDAGIETFSADSLNSLVREVIQNSLDAQKDNNKPVEVKFEVNELKHDDFPGIADLRNIFESCVKSNEEEEDAVAFFENAIEISRGKIKYLRASDYNTTGLIGADTGEKGSVWSRLIKESGSSNKAKTSGGSFGIGKAAPFAASGLRTVFYSSLDEKGVKSYIGVAKLISYFDEQIESWTTGTGYFSNSEELNAILGSEIFGQDSLREESGTDIYVMGYLEDDNTNEQIIKSVLINFLVSIWKGKLIVHVNGNVIDRNNLDSHISILNSYESKEIKETISYYKLLMEKDETVHVIKLNSKEYGSKYGFEDSSCVLYLMEGVDLNSRIMMTRKAGMKLFNQSNISGIIDFTGILMIEGEKMNNAFKEMEVPSHDSWQPGRCKNKKEAEKIYKELRDYMRLKVKEYFATATSDKMDAFGAGDFLPDTNDEDGQADNNTGLDSELKQILERDIDRKSKANQKINIEFEQGDGEGIIEPGDGGKRKKKRKRKEGQGEKGYKYLKLNQRLICSDKNAGKYVLKYIVPNTTESSYINLYIRGEQSDDVVKIKDIRVNKGQIKAGNIHENRFYLNENIQNDQVEIEFTIGMNQYFMMEAKYYEKKR